MYFGVVRYSWLLQRIGLAHGEVADPADFAVGPESEVLVVTHVLELPRDLVLPDKTAYAIFEPRDDLFLDWPDDAKAALIGMEQPPDPGTGPVQRFVFRRRSARTRPPLMLADEAFGEWVEPLIGKELSRERTGLRRSVAKRGFPEIVTIAAATRFVSTEEWPSGRSARAALLGGELDASLRALNQFLISLSLARNDASIRPLARGDLPFLCPVILETVSLQSGSRHGTSFAYQIHERTPDIPVVEEVQLDDTTLLAFQIARSAYHNAEPFFLFYELMQQAIGYFDEGRHAAAAIATGSAVEALFSATIRASSEATREDQIVRERVLDSPLRNQVEHHLGRYTNCLVDLGDANNPFGRWWQGGYQLRNRVLHNGYRPPRHESRAALDDAGVVVTAVRTGLLSRPATKEIGGTLNWGPVERRR
jgi:hypothetical protein